VLFNDLANLPVDFRLVRTVTPTNKKPRAATDETPIFLRPLDDLEVTGYCFFDGSLGRLRKQEEGN